jgi:hypothetical protein
MRTYALDPRQATLKSADADFSVRPQLKRDVLPKSADRSDFPVRSCELCHRSRAVEIPHFQTRAIFAQLNDRYPCCLAVQPDCSSKLRWQTQESQGRERTQILSAWTKISRKPTLAKVKLPNRFVSASADYATVGPE